MGDLSRNFSRSEFACHDGCGKDNIDPRIVALCQAVRDETVSFRPLSGVRCEAHNKKVGGEDNSAHVLGLAVDIPAPDSRRRFSILETALRMGARRIGIYPKSGFVHVDFADARTGHPVEVCWIG